MFYKIWLFTLHPGSWFRLIGIEQWCQIRSVTSLQTVKKQVTSRWGVDHLPHCLGAAWYSWENSPQCKEFLEELKIFSNWNQTFENHFGIWDFFYFSVGKLIKRKIREGYPMSEMFMFQNMLASWREPELFLNLVSRLYQLSWRLM